MHVRGSGRLQAPDCGAPTGPSDFAPGLIRLFLGNPAMSGRNFFNPRHSRWPPDRENHLQ